MKKITLLLFYISLVAVAQSQDISARLRAAFDRFESDSQLRHAISSLYVIDASTGEVVFDKNSQVGLAGASTQKIVTAATAFEMLGRDFRYETKFWLTKPGRGGNTEIILIEPSGDPSLGSDRYQGSRSSVIIKGISDAIQKAGLLAKNCIFGLSSPKFETNNIPRGWIWDDVGNYYGAGAYPFNWKENQADVILRAGEKKGDPVTVVSIDTLLGAGGLYNELKTGETGSGDNAYYYFFYGNYFPAKPLLRGTIPAGEKNFKISIAVADPFIYFTNELYRNAITKSPLFALGTEPELTRSMVIGKNDRLLYSYSSPSLDSLVYWFLKKSINLYGEALIKSIALRKQGFASADSGVVLVKRFWKERGLDEDELNIYDGSGLSPLNRLTTHAQVSVLKYARSRNWFPYFLAAFPEYNGMKMKSGTISDVKGFCGFQKSKEGREYIFSFLVNNYSGKSVTLVNKMYKVLDELK